MRTDFKAPRKDFPPAGGMKSREIGNIVFINKLVKPGAMLKRMVQTGIVGISPIGLSEKGLC
jgi:hypothetical protein